MFNVAVISLKDIGKFALKITALIIILIICFNFLTKKSNNTAIAFNYSFLECIDITIPGIKQIDWEKEENKFTAEKLLNTELLMASNLKVEDKNAQEEAVVQEEIADVPEKAETEVLESSVKERFTNSYAGVNIKNETDFELTEEMLSGDVQIDNPKRVLIYHTHTCESYTSSEKYPYEMTGNYRTTDLNYNVVRLGSELKKILESKNYTVIHSTDYHDFPAYSGSYDRSYTTVENLLSGEEKTDILIDIHRDSIGDSSYAPTVKIGDEYAAQMMFVIGTNGGGLEHPDWILNLRAALKIQAKANEKYPGLFKPVVLRNSRYNQNLGRAACIIEVGATGNTLEQCINSMRYFAEVLEEAF